MTLTAPAATHPTADAPLPAGLRGYAALLRRNPNARKLWLAQVVSQLGDWFNTIALLGLLVELTGNPAAGNLISLAQIVPVAIAGLFLAGVVADRYDRRAIMMITSAARGAIALSFLLIRAPDTAWIAYVGTAAIAIGTAFYMPAASAALPNIVTPNELPVAAMLGQTTFATMLFVGAFLGGAVTTLLGREAAFIANALSFWIATGLVWRARANFSARRERPMLGGASALRVLTEGMRYLKEDAFVRNYLLAKPAVAWALGGFGLFGAYSLTIYGAGDFGTSLLFAGRGIGAFISPLLVSGAASLQDARRLHRFIVAGMGLVILGYFLFAFTRSPLTGMLCAGVAHWGNAWAMTLSGLIVQAHTPDYVRGRVMALDNVGWAVVSALSNLIVASVAMRFTPQAGVLAAVALTVVSVIGWLIAMRRMPAR
ncbi:MAG: MFS transporter [Thermoflexales bacterium]